MKKNLFRIICTVLLAAMLLPLAACGNNAANAADSVYGKYICIGEDRDDGVFLDPDFDSYVELKKGGKGSMNVGFDLELTYELDGENFTGTYTLMGIDYNITGTLKDNVLEVIDGTRKSRYLKEGATAPDWAKNGASAPSSSDDFSANTLAGNYYISTMILNGQALDHNAVIAAGMADNTYIKINSDDTGVYSFNGEAERTFTLDTMSGVLTFDGGATLTFVDEGEGTVSVLYPDQNMTVYFQKEGIGDSTNLPGTSFPTGNETIEREFPIEVEEIYSGDWVGKSKFYSCTGRYEDNDGGFCHIIARILFNEYGECTIYAKLGIYDGDEINLKDLYVTYNEADGDMYLHGVMMRDQELTDESFVSYVEDEDLLYINVAIDNDGSTMKILSCLKPLGADWTGDEYLALEDEYVQKYKSMTLEEVANYINADISGLPEAPAAHNSDPGDNTPTNVPEPAGGYGKSNASATGVGALEDMQALYKLVYDNRSNAYHLFTYEQARDKFGSDGIPWQETDNTWNDKVHSYKWEDGNGEFLYITFEIEGNEEWYFSCTYSTNVKNGLN